MTVRAIVSRKTVSGKLELALHPTADEGALIVTQYIRDQIPELCGAIERELFKVCGNSVSRKYYRKARQLVFNLKDQKNVNLRQRVFSGELAAETLVRLDANGMANPQLVAARKQWMMKRKQEVMRETPKVAGFIETDIFTCASCRSNKTRYRQWRRKAIVDRTRIIVVCLNCPNRWEL